jgi:Ca2+-binding EF-hand superfamily protein
MSEKSCIGIELPIVDPACEDAFIELFQRADRNGDGRIEKPEFLQLIQTIEGIPKNPYVFRIVDADNNGSISVHEFLQFGRAVWAIAKSGNLASYLRLVFIACDKTKKGYLTSREFFKFMKYLGAPVVLWERREMFKSFDHDGNGIVDFDEIQKTFQFYPT